MGKKGHQPQWKEQDTKVINTHTHTYTHWIFVLIKWNEFFFQNDLKNDSINRYYRTFVHINQVYKQTYIVI